MGQGNADNYTKFREAVKNDSELEAKVMEVNDWDELITLANGNGHALSIEDVKAWGPEMGDGELHERELEAVAGGKRTGSNEGEPGPGRRPNQRTCRTPDTCYGGYQSDNHTYPC